MKQFVLLLFVLSFVLAACSAGETPAPPTITPVPAAQQAPTELPPTEPPPTATPEPPTAAPPPAEIAVEPTSEPASQPAEPVSSVRTFAVVPEQSRASYIVAEEFFGGALDALGIQPGLVDTVGSTQEVTGQMQLDLANPTQPVVSSQFTVNLQSLTSNQSRRDNRIRQANLESNTYPLATFTLTSIENGPAAYTEGQEVTFLANGDITIREVTRPAVFEVTAKLEGGVISGVATTQLKMTDFGFEPPNFANLFSVADDFTAKVEFVFQEQ